MKSENWDIIAMQLAKEELSGEEMEILESLRTDSEMKKIIDQSAEVFDKTGLYFNTKKYDTDKAWDRVNGQLAHQKKGISLSWALRIAAVVLLLLTTGISVWQFGQKRMKYNEFATTQTNLSKPEIVLPDGTKVTLNYSSTIGYPEKFTGDTREITLSGEAFFDVTPNPDKPFVIKTNSALVKVLGTSFNVNAYKNAPLVEVVVKTGKVELLENTTPNVTKTAKVLLLPGDKGVFDKLSRKLTKEATLNNNNLSWITHEIEFDYAPLNEVVGTLCRTFNLQIDIEKSVDQDLQLSATFNKQKPDYIMDVVALTLNLKVEKTGDNHYIIRNR